MSIIPWNRKRNAAPESSLAATRLRSEVGRLLDRFLQDPWSWPEDFMASVPAWAPTVDIGDSEHEITIRAEMPGLNPEDFTVTISENFLTISGEKKESTEDKGKDYYHCESSYGSFKRIIELPQSMDAAKVTAECTNGILTVHVPKPESAKRRQIEVKPSGASRQPRKVPVGAA